MAHGDGGSYYDVLGVESDATPEEIRRAYLRRARLCHPDKNEDPDAKAQFQQLQRIYAVLSSPSKRQAYDADGADEDDAIDGRFGAAPITEEDILSFAREYLGSDVEKEDLLQNYTQHRGNMEKVLDYQILSDPKFDAHRFAEILDEAIAAEKVRSYKAYDRWRTEILKKPRPNVSFAKRFKRRSEEVDELALIEKIRTRGAKHMAFVDDLKTRFCGSGPTPYDTITEEEFQDAQARLLSPGKKRKLSPASDSPPRTHKQSTKRRVRGGVQKRRSQRLAKKKGHK